MIDWIVERLLEGKNSKKRFIKVLRKDNEHNSCAKVISRAKPSVRENKRNPEYIASLYNIQEKSSKTVLHNYFADIKGIK